MPPLQEWVCGCLCLQMLKRRVRNPNVTTPCLLPSQGKFFLFFTCLQVLTCLLIISDSSNSWLICSEIREFAQGLLSGRSQCYEVNRIAYNVFVLFCSSATMSLKTPSVDVWTERRGLQRNVPNRQKVSVEEFGAAVYKRQMGIEAGKLTGSTTQ